jgi:hypothetical protein
MAGKTVAKAAKAEKAAVKKVDGKKAAKPVAVVKKPVAKKADGVKKAVAKKPNVGTKFNLHKLIMLIIRDAPKAKKGNKMTGGYDAASIQPIKNLITDFINDKSKRIRDRITDCYSAAGTNQFHKTHAETTAAYIANVIDSTNIANFHLFVSNILQKNFNNAILEINSPTTFDSLSINERDKRIYNVNLMTIVIALCDVYMRYHNNVNGRVSIINITDMPP